MGVGMAGSRPGRAEGQCIQQMGTDLLNTEYWVLGTGMAVSQEGREGGSLVSASNRWAQ